MQSYGNLYTPMLDKNFIKSCCYEAAKGKRNRRSVKHFFDHLDKEIDIIVAMLENDAYYSPKYTSKTINENSSHKTREIVQPYFKYEQIVHRMFVEQFKAVVMHSQIETSCGSIPERGVHFAKRYIEKWIHGYGNKRFYILKTDIHHFFGSIDRSILKKKIRAKIRDDRFYTLACRIIDYDESSVGVPLGFYTSQWFGNFYLDELDHYILEVLKPQHYLRYADDMVFFDTSKRKLHKIQKAVAEYMAEKLHLTMKDNWQVFRFEDKNGEHGRALDFLGFVFHRNRTCIRKSILRASRRKAYRIKRKRPTWYSATQMISYLGWYDDTNSYHYFKRYITPSVNIKQLKKVVAKHSKGEVENGNRMESSQIGHKTGADRHNNVKVMRVSAQRH